VAQHFQRIDQGHGPVAAFMKPGDPPGALPGAMEMTEGRSSTSWDIRTGSVSIAFMALPVEGRQSPPSVAAENHVFQ